MCPTPLTLPTGKAGLWLKKIELSMFFFLAVNNYFAEYKKTLHVTSPIPLYISIFYFYSGFC